MGLGVADEVAQPERVDHTAFAVGDPEPLTAGLPDSMRPIANVAARKTWTRVGG